MKDRITNNFQWHETEGEKAKTLVGTSYKHIKKPEGGTNGAQKKVA